ncbi:MAG: tandem-95 repeat protein, partial [Acidobacteria bacterium]|nr:tandem-95 repeat protein [Acidobacteriota bacterium]
DAPSFTIPTSTSSNEDAGTQTIPSFATAISAGPADESGQTLTFTVTQTAADPTLTFTVAPAIAADGTLTYTAAPNAYGTATFSVVLTDDGSNTAPNVNASSTHTFTITINPINDPPSFTIPASTMSQEDGGPQSVNAFATAISAGPNETGQTLTFTVTPTGTTGALAFTSAPTIAADGTLIYTAAPNTSGTATFSVVLTDSGSNVAPNVNASAAQTFTITVNAVNDAPSFTIPTSTSSNEDAGTQTIPSFATAISAGPADESGQTLTFTVTQTAADPTLTFTSAPAIAANGTLTYTAAPNAYGTATFSVVLTDSGSNVAPNVNTSSAHTFTITINPINDAPVAADDAFAYPTDGSPLTVNAPGVLANDSDIDSAGLTAAVVTPPSEGTLSLQSNGSFTYTKAASPAATSVTFTYRASDGLAFSNVATVTITLNAPPVAGNDAFTLREDQTVTEPAPGLLANDSDANDNISLVQLVSGPDCAGYASGTCGTLTLALMQDGSFTYEPPADFNGVATFTYKLIDDAGLESAPATVTLTVLPVNDAPSFTALTVDVSGAQNAGLLAVPFATNILRGPVTATDETSQHVHFETDIYLGGNLLQPFVDVDAGIASTTGLDIDSTGTLRFRPGSTTGTVRAWVRIVDDGGIDNGGVDASDAIELVIRITAVVINKAPSFNVSNITVNEDAAPQSVANWVTSISAGANEGSQTVTMSIDSYTNPSLFSVAPTIVSNNRLTYTLAPNAVGSSTLTVKAVDNGGTANGGVDTTTKTATITVTAVNDAPSFTKGADLAYASGTSGLQTVAGWATGISAGPSDESAQTLTFSVTVRSGSSIFTGTPALASNGTLTFTLNGTTGLAVIDVRLADSGGTANGGVNQSAIQTFTINAGNVNTPPSFVKGSDITVLEDSGPATYPGWATAISPGSASESSQTVSFTVTASTPSLFSTQPTVDASGTLTFVPAANQFGSTTVTVRAVDNGGTAGGGVNTSDPQTFTLTITGVNDAPTLSIPSPSVTGGENGGPRSIANFAVTTAGPSETGQTPFTYTVVQTGGSATLFDSANGGAAPSISATGTLTFTTAVNESGSATFSVTVRDSGGTANGGVDTSAASSFTITIGTGGPTVPGGSIAFDAYANIPITVGAVAAESSYNLLNGASDPDLPLSVLITSKPANARVDVAADGSFTFRSGTLAYAGGAIQPQSFKWRVCDSIGNCSAERTANVSFIGPLVFFSDAAAATSPGLYTLDVPGKSLPSGFTTSAAPPATYIIKSGTYSMGTTGATTQLAIRAGDKVYGQGTAGLTLASLGISQAALTVGTLPALPDYSTGTIPTLHMPDPTFTSGGGIVITQSPFFKGYGGGSVKHLRFTRAAERTASWILFSNASWTSTPGDYLFDDIISVNGQGFAIPQVGSSITVKNSDLTISEGFGMNGGTISVINTPIRLTSTDTSSSSILFSDFDSTTVGTITATVDAASPITIANNVGYLFPITISNPAWMPLGTFTIDSDITITRTSTTVGLFIKLMSNVALNGKVTVTTATGKPVDLLGVSNLTMPNAANTAKMTATPASALNGGITMNNVTAGAAGIKLTNIDVRKGYLSFSNTDGAPAGPITVTGGTIVGDFLNPCISTSLASNVTVTGVTTSNCGS